MGQPHSTPQRHSADYLESFHAEQLDQLREQLVRLADALALVEASPGEPQSDHAGSLLSGAKQTVQQPQAADSATTTLSLEPFAQVHLAGYRLGDAVLTVPLTLSPEQPPTSVLSLLGRNTALTTLDLSYNALTSAVVKPLLDAVAALPALTVLRLSGNALGTASSPPRREGASSVVESAPQAHVSAPAAAGLSLAEEVTLSSVPSSARTAAAQLGRWLATSPPLLELSLYQCNLNDYDVQALLRGLARPNNAIATSATAATAAAAVVVAAPSPPPASPLTVLHLAGNPACTWRSAQLVLQLVTDFGNTSLRVVTLEGAEPATDVRLEYACTPNGYFRSGATLVSTLDQNGATTTSTAAPATAHTAADAVDAELLESLTPGQLARFHGRCQYLREDLDGARVMPPALMQKLHVVFSARQKAAAAAAEEAVAVAAEAVAPVDVAAATVTAERASGESTEEVCVESKAVDTSATSRDVEEDAAAQKSVNAVDVAAQGAAATAPSSSPPSTPPRFMTSSYMRRSPQERRAARFEAPERIAHVMAEARAFRRHLHPLQVDTHAPPCAYVHARSTSSYYGSEAAASTWYAREGFVLRLNGMSRVLVAPVLPDAASARCNVLLTDVEDRPLRACWCTPHNAANAAHAGTLHYHCVREGEPVRHKDAAAAAAVRRQQKDTRPGSNPAAAQLLPPLTAATATSTAGSAPAHVPSTGDSPAYRGCCGTGHACLSASVAANGPLRSQRMRTTLLTQSTKRVPSLTAADAADHAMMSRAGVDDAREALQQPSLRAKGLSASSSSKGSAGLGQSVTTTFSTSASTVAAMTMFGGATTVHKTSNGLSVALNYSPATFFAGPHVPCAGGIQVEECI